MSKQTTPDVTPWQTISSAVALNEPYFTVRKDVVKLPSGDVMDDYFVWEIADVVVTAPITKDGKFVVCQQYRHGVGKVLYQFPAGMVDAGETPVQAAARELGEETGYHCDKLVLLSKTAQSAAKATGWQYLFLAQGVEYKERLLQPHADEEIKVVLKTPKQLKHMIAQGEFPVPDSLVAALLAMQKLGL